MIEPERLMQLAIDKAREGVTNGQSPFGCAIALGDSLVAVCHNTVVVDLDVTAHAEINALRAAGQATGRILLDHCQVATTCEPCPMCIAALHWARVDCVYYGASIADAHSAGFNELTLSAADVLRQGQSAVRLMPDVLADCCRELFDEWRLRRDREVY